MKFDIPPIEKSKRSGLLDETVLKLSKGLFEIPLFGYGIAIIVNILFIYLWYKRTTFFSLCFFFFLYYIIIRIIQIKILG